ncbi:undecaprenyl-phosphate alpha-N-acetylglucosaminyl 1-phosphate transferase [Pseudoalteromonas sp. S1727]|uniref:UDP-N-acetylglucosamine--undecaprenyl-phosphate N-acetylglucosaminephosphotransferase n=1 Tax=Pseudoalteromonas sp. S1727 TaxID=2066514 RepID=UPI001109AA4B|nr:UDP-N-acetylglucosamine--undecaprenyl-phosphate N-acetylglucosaminephosphotransferase [Pseudoalteromonas sp. S1727]TMN65953.1 undecaprenyl-phosphate alpha-N-acetylglucosaminyl 1-phosphate transferase [Pseudoalteromonas sp. S1727]
MSLIIYSSLVTLFSLIIMKRVSLSIGLLDKPNERKLHDGMVPLIGGICVFVGAFSSLLIIGPITNELLSLFLVAMGIVLLGVLDDKYDLSVTIRLFFQSVLTISLIFYQGHYISYLGNILGFGNISLGVFGIVFTIIAVVAAINAFNMLDGIDGLVGGSSIVSLIGIAAIAYTNSNITILSICIAMIVALSVYLFFNINPFKVFKNKVFMGDAGSMLVGFLITWLIVLSLELPDGRESLFRPVTALYLLALPLMDMIAIMYRRVKKKESPFKADRDHIHHIFMRLGFSDRQALLILVIFATLFMLLGLSFEYFAVPEWFSLLIFCAFFLFYCHFIQHAWVYTKNLKVLLDKIL